MIETSEEFTARRLGRVGASRIADIMAKGKGMTRKRYMSELLRERLTGKVAERFKTKAVEYGKETEDEARDAYELETGIPVIQCRGCAHPFIIGAGASPDGLICDDEKKIILGCLEIKVPEPWTHDDFIETGIIDLRYKYQMNFQMACVRPVEWWCDHENYDPDLPGRLSCIIKRYYFDPKMEEEIEKEIIAFIEELDALEARMRERMA
ncbi:MAG: YqaJ viral recombinase family protein [Candidatus Omnitrophota bacterium]